jgi:hypothetical protein
MKECGKCSSSITNGVARCSLRAFPLSAAGEPSQLEANMGDVVSIFLLAVPPVFDVEGNAAFDNARVRDAAVAGAEESV